MRKLGKESGQSEIYALLVSTITAAVLTPVIFVILGLPDMPTETKNSIIAALAIIDAADIVALIALILSYLKGIGGGL